MNISRVIAAVALLVITMAIIAFAVMNPGERVLIHLGWQTYTNVPMILALFIAFVIGIALTLIYSLYYFIDLGLTVRRLKSKNKTLERELLAIRSLPLEDSPDDAGPG
ncbi:MAG: LapA family protein, partial [bacterium]